MLTLFVAPLAPGCVGPNPPTPPPKPPIRPEPVPQPPRKEQGVIHCADHTWYWDSVRGGWYWEETPGGVRHYGQPCTGTPFPRGGEPLPDNRFDLGLIPDENGNVAPAMWWDNWESAHAGQVSLDDRFDLSFAAEADWILPFETDMDLLEAIGRENISFGLITLSAATLHPELPPPILVSISRIGLGDAINLLAQLRITGIVLEVEGEGSYTIRLDGPAPDGYTEALVYQDGGIVAHIRLR